MSDKQNVPQQIVIDTDVGFDDLFGISLLLKNSYETGNLFIKDIVTVQGLQKSAIEAKFHISNIINWIFQHDSTKFLENHPISYHIGESKFFGKSGHSFQVSPFFNAGNYSKHVYSLSNWVTGQDFGPLPSSSSDSSSNVVEIYKQIFENAQDSSISLLLLGPLTNMAHFLQEKSNQDLLLKKVNKIVIMGGSLFLRPVLPTNGFAEFNFYNDPEATKFFFETLSKLNTPHEFVHLCGLDVANIFIFNAEQQKQLLSNVEAFSANKRFNQYYPTVRIRNILFTMMKAYLESATFDPITATSLIHPEFFKFKKFEIFINEEAGKEAETVVAQDQDSKLLTKILGGIELEKQKYRDFVEEQMKE